MRAWRRSKPCSPARAWTGKPPPPATEGHPNGPQPANRTHPHRRPARRCRRLFRQSRQPAQSLYTPRRGISTETVNAQLALSLPDTHGQAQAIEQWRGKVIVANFWATWCPPCRKEIPDFAAASQALAVQPVQFVGISIDSLEKVQAFNDEFKVPYPLLIAGPEALALAAGFGNDARALPFTGHH
ncbi:TlpA disulfide reductase family protein [Thauera humireducens]|uniref:TlpA family protein disulfide reductase n=1 Tax=Thauera humireducens TaxID=1134435 RepID=UPI00311F71E8